MNCPALIQIPDGNWIDPSLVTTLLAFAVEPEETDDRRIGGKVAIISAAGPSIVLSTTTHHAARDLRDEIAGLILDAHEPFRIQE